MGGGLMQLVAYGTQDIYLTGNPQITFFKVVYRRHTNFSMELIQQTWDSTIAAGSKTSCIISRNGDLVHEMYLMTLAGGTHVTADGNNPGHNVISSVACEIGGQEINKHYGHWMETQAQLNDVPEQQTAIPTGSGGRVSALPLINHSKFQAMALAGGVTVGNATLTNSHFIPLRFWFCRNVGLSLPLIALQYHEVKIVVNWSDSCTGTAFTNSELMVQYIYLDTDERRMFAQVSHEYLIEQVQHQEAEGTITAKTLNFNHPVKELVWVGKQAGGVEWGTATTGGILGLIQNSAGTAQKWNIKLNGHDRMALIDTNYFTVVQRLKNHNGGLGHASHVAKLANTIACYSFALNPEEHQPSGTCNFSRIDNVQLVSSSVWTDQGLYIYAVNYNVLRIMSGMGGIAYSN